MVWNLKEHRRSLPTTENRIKVIAEGDFLVYMDTCKSKKIQLFVLIVIILLLFLPLIGHADQDTEDVFASVVVLPTFKIEIDNNYLDFGLVNPGESVTLKQGTYYNTIRCVSNKGIKYYVKLHILGDIIGPKGNKIPPASFKWKVYYSSGSGTPVTKWQEFSDEPVIVYTSGAEDEIGSESKIRFQYKLDLPSSVRGGHYSLKVAYLLTEEE